jgi:methionyl aminopeptidase|uniref:Methionine aminopeptidase n=1 Tax=candidate division WOR-3 bacterium TaxID=2052148 RepID=A0A7C3YQ22_UNCW3
MPVYIKSKEEIKRIREAGRIVAEVLTKVERKIKPGVSLKELEEFCDDLIRKRGGLPAFKGYKGFPASVCISLNEEIVHGIPNGRRLKEGDIIKIDVGVIRDGYFADGAKTYPLGKVSKRVLNLIQVTREALYSGIKCAKEGRRVGDIGSAIQKMVENAGFSIVRELTGHGVGILLHEDPPIPNFGKEGEGVILKSGMTLAIEPMVNLGSPETCVQKNGWTVVAKDGLPSCHFEHTILVTEDEPEILTDE